MNEMVERVATALADLPGDPSPLTMARAAVAAMREPTADMIAAAIPCTADDGADYEAKKIGAAAVMKLSEGKNLGTIEGQMVEQAAFMVRDWRLMINAALDK